jgi:predicted Abi (CAAX) family protease
MFIAAILLTSVLSLAGLLSSPHEALLSWTPVSLEGQGLEGQLYAVQAFLIVALGEELWSRMLLGYGGSAVAGPRTAWFWSTLWFLYMHTPSRIQYGILAPVIIALLGTIMLVFMVFFRRNPSVWTGVVMHATYNTLLAGVYYGTLLLELAVLAVLLYALSKITEVRIEIKLPKLEEVVLHG